MIYLNPATQKKRLEKGQSLVEFAISLMFLTMILWGVLDLARLYYIFISIEDAAGEAALYLSLNPGCKDASSGPTCTGTNNAEWRARHANSNYVSFDWYQPGVDTVGDYSQYNAELSTSPTTPGGAGNTVTVSITYYAKLITPIIPSIAGVNPLPITATTTQTIIRD